MLITDAYADDENTITVQETAKLPKVPDQIQSGWTSMIPMILIFVVFYFLLIRPQEKRRRQQEALVGGVQRGEEVLTNSGIFGIVIKINDSDNTVEVEIAKETNVKMLKSAIADIISRKTKEKMKKDIKKDKGNSGAKAS